MLVEDEHVEAAHDFSLRMYSHYLECRTNSLGVMHVHTRNERIRIAMGNHDRSKIIPVVQKLVRFAEAQALSLSAIPEIGRVRFAARRSRRIFDADLRQRDAILFRDSRNVVRIAEENRLSNSFVDDHLRRANYFWLFAFGEYDLSRITHRAVD